MFWFWRLSDFKDNCGEVSERFSRIKINYSNESHERKKLQFIIDRAEMWEAENPRKISQKKNPFQIRVFEKLNSSRNNNWQRLESVPQCQKKKKILRVTDGILVVNMEIFPSTFGLEDENSPKNINFPSLFHYLPISCLWFLFFSLFSALPAR